LGWIGNGSALFEQVAATWAGRPSRNTDKLEPDSKVETFTLLQPGIDPSSKTAMAGAMRCQVWVHNDSAAIRWIQPVREMLASVLFSRPALRIPLLSGNGISSAKAKAWIAGGVLVAAAALVWPVHYPVAATVSVETLSGRYVAMPFDARLLEVQVKPGQHVSAGQPLLQLDGRPLRIELETLETELQQAVKEHNAALASRRIADAQQAMLEQKKKQRSIDLVKDRLRRLSVTSPIAGVVLSGDLKRLVGSPLELGQTLVEVAAMDAVAVELEIPEHEIGFITKGMDTRIKIDALGGQSLHLPLGEIYPAAELRNDQNVFVGRIEVANQDGKLRPGMKGKAVAYGPIRPWIWSWVRGAVERLLWTVGY
jgi:multidrug efflux pump subunit AcrA (membrane-fusion protein)